ncbi:MAG: class I SAM-dependent methyltransferase [Thiolinea sp.]
MRTRKPLPLPSPQALEHSKQLSKVIKRYIDEAGGSIPFRQYMHMALYQPGLGYYVAGQEKFGHAGDFVTAPEISPLFSQCIANHCATTLSIIDFADSRQILELGAGTGIMAADILTHLSSLEALPDCYFILELSPELRQRQRKTLEQHCPELIRRVEWLQELPAEPINGVILANEVPDAMPVEFFSIEGEKVSVTHVAANGDDLYFKSLPPDEIQLQTIKSNCFDGWDQYYDAFRPATAYYSEYNPALTGWINSLSDTLNRGEILIIDYGYERSDYYRPERNQGTLLCHYQHHVHDQPLLWPGLQDITASVDFTAIAEAADQAGLTISRYCSQADFLFHSDLETLFNQALNTQPEQQYQLAQQVRTLTLPSEMGERFKVMSLTKGFTTDEQTHTLSGFQHSDRRHRL